MNKYKIEFTLKIPGYIEMEAESKEEAEEELEKMELRDPDLEINLYADVADFLDDVNVIEEEYIPGSMISNQDIRNHLITIMNKDSKISGSDFTKLCNMIEDIILDQESEAGKKLYDNIEDIDILELLENDSYGSQYVDLFLELL